MNDNPFVQEVRENPRDDTPRLVYADFLEEAGDQRCELIRVQVELASLKTHDPRRTSLEQRETELLQEYGDQWLEEIRELGVHGTSIRCFHKGLVERVKVSPGVWEANGAKICELSPALHQLQFTQFGQGSQALLRHSLPQQIKTLDLSANGLDEAAIAGVCNSPWIESICQLDLAFNRLHDAGVQRLQESNWPMLESLSLNANGIGPDGATHLSTWESLARLTSLSLSVNRLGVIGVQRLAASMLLGNLRHLDLSSNQITAAGANNIADSDFLPKLAELSLRSNQITEDAMQAILKSPKLLSLRSADFRANPIHVRRGQYGYGTETDQSAHDLLIQLPPR